MNLVIRRIVRWSAYPIVLGGCAVALVRITSSHLPYWPLAPLVSLFGIACVALLERLQPYEPAWLADHGDTREDMLHAFVSLTLIFTSVKAIDLALRYLHVPSTAIWPTQWPMWAQVLLAGAIIDFGLWFMHWASHKNASLWRLHALHHSAERLYWLNGERRHPLSAMVLGTPGLVLAALAGAPPAAIGCWLAIVSVHLAFQHANLDYSVGPLRRLLGVAEIHRWHHKREYEDAQVNFGEFWLIWDQLFGTFHYHRNGVGEGDVGLRNERMPDTYLAQLTWPWRR
ncbi:MULTISPECIES: sterol desaturase family protein [Noviherbaspirillum]|jgi:sterol desaturase/sphingolipid hydroxylase (fatty acid hydroxylase superfamily)|uniref:sterol desaturase family protein n=1 Tax=Noviherbaspirillum TaxID=1344552 RepID=UPI00124E90C1|nr:MULTISPECIES: sterol desaturase family protein [Noviherbaspirillum]